MPGTTNFLQWDPNGVNQENDAAYAGDGLRSAGAPANAIFPGPTANKLFYQLSTFITAFCTALASKGYSPNDGSTNPPTSVPNLAAVLANIMTAADMTPFATKNNPVFTGDPQAPTAAPGDNDTSIATTAFVTAAVSALATYSFTGTSGFIKFPLLGGFMIQWFIGAQDAANEFQVTKNFPIAFPGHCMAVQVTYGNTPGVQANDSWYQVVSFNAASVTLYKQGTGGTQQVSSPYILAFGI